MDPFTAEEDGSSAAFGDGHLAPTFQGAAAIYTNGAVDTFLSQPRRLDPNRWAGSVVPEVSPATLFNDRVSQVAGPCSLRVTTNNAVRGSNVPTLFDEYPAFEDDEGLNVFGLLMADGEADMTGIRCIGDWSNQQMPDSPVQSAPDGATSHNPITATVAILSQGDGIPSNDIVSQANRHRINRGRRGRRGSGGTRGTRGARGGRGGRGSARGGHTSQTARGDDSREFACPFYKQDPAKYGLICGHRKWAADDVHRIKQHIEDAHSLPLYQCDRCNQDLETSQAFSLHEKDPNACVPCGLSSSGINAKQALLLKSRKGGWGKPAEEKWSWIYQTVFPLDSVIPDPYHNSLSHSRINNEFSLLHDYRVRLDRNLVSMIKSSNTGLADDMDWGKLQKLLNRDYCDFLQEVQNNPKHGELQQVSTGPVATETRVEIFRSPSYTSELFPSADLGSRDGTQGDDDFIW